MAEEKRFRKFKTTIIVFCVLLAVSILVLTFLIVKRKSNISPVDSIAPNNIISEENNSGDKNLSASKEDKVKEEFTPHLSLHRFSPEGKEEFTVQNLLPGDRVSKEYEIAVSFKDSMDLCFYAPVKEDIFSVSDVLKCSVAIKDSGQILYDGLLKDMPSCLTYRLYSKEETTKTVTYLISVYLDTSVGNEYMSGKLTADFNWWAETRENLVSPETGLYGFISVLYALIALASFLVIIITVIRRKRTTLGDENEQNIQKT